MRVNGLVQGHSTWRKCHSLALLKQVQHDGSVRYRPRMAAPILSYEDLGLIQGEGWLFRGLDLYIGTRDRLLMEIFYATGMRLSELVNLKDKDFDLGNCQVKVLGKRNKERIIPFADPLKNMIKAYLALKGTQDFTEQSPRFFVDEIGDQSTSKAGSESSKKAKLSLRAESDSDDDGWSSSEIDDSSEDEDSAEAGTVG